LKSGAELVKNSLESRVNTPFFHPVIINSLVPTPEYNPQFKFNHLRQIGYSKILQDQPPESKPSKPDPLYLKMLELDPSFSELRTYADYKPAVHNKERYMISLNKCDVPRIFPDDFILSKACDYVYQMYLPFLGGQSAKSVADYTPSSSPGLPYKRMLNPQTGKFFSCKREFLESPEAVQTISSKYDPMFSIFGKVEFLPNDDVDVSKKLRSVFNGPVDFIINQKLMYGPQDEALKLNASKFFSIWSRYGFTRQYGGLDSLAKYHQTLNEMALDEGKRVTHSVKDVSGWDRVFPLMPQVYNLRKRWYGKMTEPENFLADYISKNVSEPYCSLYNGQIVQRLTGNNSGQGATTADNTIGHTIIEMYTLMTMYYELHGELPSLDFIMERTRISLFGDDDLTSYIVEDWIGSDDPAFFFSKYREIYKRFAMIIKDKQFKYQYDEVIGLEFLGATLTKAYGKYIGTPRYGKIFTSFSSLLEGERDPLQYASMIEAATALTYDLTDPKALLLRRYMISLSGFLLTNHAPDLPRTIVDFLYRVSRSEVNMLSLVYGYEARPSPVTNIHSGFFSQFKLPTNFFFTQQHCRRRVGEVGFKSDIMEKSIQFQINTLGQKELKPSDKFFSKFDKNFNYVGFLNENLQGEKLPTNLDVKFTRTGPDHASTYWATVLIGLDKFSGEGMNKQSAKNALYFQLCQNLAKLRLFLSTPVNAVPYLKPAESPSDLQRVELSGAQVQSLEKRRLAFAESFVFNFQVYSTLTEQQRKYHIFGKFLGDDGPTNFLTAMNLLDLSYADPDYVDDAYAQARLASSLKTGGFNPYGNGQSVMQQFIFTQPDIIGNSDGTFTCFSTCLTPNPTNYSGSGEDEQSAFADWLANATDSLTQWAPIAPQTDFVQLIRTLPPPPSGHKLSFLWTQPFRVRDLASLLTVNPTLLTKISSEIYSTDSDDGLKYKPKSKDKKKYEGSFNSNGNTQISALFGQVKDSKKFEGSYNSYGNTQMSKVMSKTEYLSMNNIAFKNLTPEQRTKKWKAYANRNKKPVKQAPKMSKPLTRTAPQAPRPSTSIVSMPQQGRRANGHLSQCSKEWYVALRCPFFQLDEKCPDGLQIPKDAQICIPTFPGLKTRKVSYFARGVVGIQANGFGFIAFAPRRLANNNNPVSNTDPPLLFSISTNGFGPGLFPAIDTGAGWLGGSASLNTDHSGANLVSSAVGIGITYRIAAAGLKIKTTVAPITATGNVHFFIEPDHQTVNALSVAAIGGYESYFFKPLSECFDWTQLTYEPTMPEEINDFLRDGPANPPITPYVDYHYIGIMITGAPPGDIIYYEAVVHVEELGRTIRGKTQTPVDIVGTSIVMNTAKATNQVEYQENVYKNPAQDLAKAATNVSTAPSFSGVVKDAMEIGKELKALLM
jgi:hypothetical protein